MTKSLKGKIAVVTGSSRGVGRGIALALADRGATVYVTGRTEDLGTATLPGTIFDAAAAVDERGGVGIPVRVDLTEEADIARLFGRVRSEHGRLDLLVNNAIAIPPEMTAPEGFWEKPLANLEILDIGLRAAFVCAWHAAQMMVPQGSGLIVGMSGYVGVNYTYGPIFGATKAGLDRMARDMAIELKPSGVASLSLWQGFTFTERAKHNLATVPGMAAQLHSAAGSSPEFPGRVIAALAMDPDVLARTGGSYIVAELAAEYGIKDVDGRQIPSLRAERGAPIWQAV